MNCRYLCVLYVQSNPLFLIQLLNILSLYFNLSFLFLLYLYDIILDSSCLSSVIYHGEHIWLPLFKRFKKKGLEESYRSPYEGFLSKTHFGRQKIPIRSEGCTKLSSLHLRDFRCNCGSYKKCYDRILGPPRLLLHI